MDCSFLYVAVASDKGDSFLYVVVGFGTGIPWVVEAMLAFPLGFPIQERVDIHTLTQGSEVVVDSSGNHKNLEVVRIKQDQGVGNQTP